MKTYLEVGERGYYDKKRFICIEGNVGCEGCDLASYIDTPKVLCEKVLCKFYQRPDRKNVVFRLQPKYRKVVKHVAQNVDINGIVNKYKRTKLWHNT